MAESESCCFADALFESVDVSDFTAEADLSDCADGAGVFRVVWVFGGWAEGAVGVCACDGESDGEVGCGFDYFHAAYAVDEDILIGES